MEEQTEPSTLLFLLRSLQPYVIMLKPFVKLTKKVLKVRFLMHPCFAVS